jgi:Secretion system C-terminal sorting domain/Viral BACON domain
MKYFIALFWCCAFQMMWAQQTSSLLTDGNFSQNPTSWIPSNDRFEVITDNCAGSGSRYAYFRPTSGTTGEMYKEITLPANTTRIDFTYRYSISTSEIRSSGAVDILRVGIWDFQNSDFYNLRLSNVDAGEFLTVSQLATSCAPYYTNSGYVNSGRIIGNAQSQTVRFLLEGTSDGSLPTVFRVDDITVTATYSNPCVYSLNSSSQSIQSAGGGSSVTVNTGSGCTWSASTDCNWVTLNQTSGTGSTSIGYSVAANSSQSPRTCTITVSGQTHTITQTGVSCNYSLSSSSQSFQSAGGSNSVTVNTGNGCNWSASTNCNWVTLNQTSGSGSGTVNYTVAANSTQIARTCTISVNGQTLTVTQMGLSCNYSLNPTSQSFQSNASSGSVSVNTNNGCNWTASTDCNWVTLNSNLGTGTGTVAYNMTANATQNTRTCNITVNGQTHTITQSGLNCNYTLNAPSNTFQSSGGNGSVSITTNNGCSWSASTDCNWVTLTNSTGTNTGTIHYNVATNSTSTNRTCTITINGQTHVVTQSGVSSCDLVTPMITTIGCDLKVDAQTNAKYQWQVSGGDIFNATTRFHTAVRRGFYNCIVTKINDATCTKISADFYSNCTNRIDEMAAIHQMVVYPNPNNGLFIVDFDLPEPKITTIRVYNALGQCVATVAAEKRVGHQTQSIDLNKGTSGLYWVEIQLDEQKIVKKVMIE